MIGEGGADAVDAVSGEDEIEVEEEFVSIFLLCVKWRGDRGVSSGQF